MRLVRQLWYILNRRERIEALFLLCGMALGAVLEAMGVGLLYPFIAALKEPNLIFDAPLARPVLSALDIATPDKLMAVLGIGLVVVFVIKSGYLVLWYWWLYRYIFAEQVKLGRRLLTGYLSAPYPFHLQRNSAEMVEVTTQTIQRFTGGFLASLLTVAGELLVVMALIVLMVYVEPMATLGAVVALGVPTALLYWAMQRRLAVLGRLAQVSFTSMIQWTNQALSGIKETLVMGRGSFFVDRHAEHLGGLSDAMRSFSQLSAIPRLVIDTLAVTAMVVIALIILARGHDVESILPVLAMFAVAAMRLMPSTSRIANGLAQLRYHHIATTTLYDELRAIDRYAGSPAGAVPANRLPPPMPFRHALAIDHLSYRYPGSSRAAVDDISLEIPRGHWVGFIGPTGAGKTTLVDLLLGLFVPTAGRILVDGDDLQDNLAAWRRNLGYVPQDIYLIDDTVRRNVGFGLPDEEIDDERVWRALREAQVDDFVRSLPGGLGAMIGERGERISGGERQRLGIARALYHDPEVLILDEGTAHLDPETEAAIIRTLAGLRGAKTIIVIAHRFPLVERCDCVYLLRQGRVCNSGVYSELVASEPGFRQYAGSAV